MTRRSWPTVLYLLVFACAAMVTQAVNYAPEAAPEGGQPTKFPAGRQPDQITLTWAGDPSDSVSIQWRTSTAVATGAVAYVARSAWVTFHPAHPTVIRAETERLEAPGCINDPHCHHHTVRLKGLKPDTEYLYAVGDGNSENWGELRSFRTASARAQAFSFIYMGDAQYGFSRWGALQRAALRNRPDAAFFLMAGDLVTRGNDRDDWDDLLMHGSGVFSRVPVVPAVGNHECKPDGPVMYQQMFDLPRNGPADMDPERVYAIEYGGALFVILDSNLSPSGQTAWLEDTLANSDAVWKFVMFHHPVYSSEPKRDNQAIRETWGPIFDKYHVDLVFQGHDHAYLRTHPMYDQKRVGSPAEGTIYLVTVSGTKMYQQAERDYTEVGFTKTATYSVIDILPVDSKVAHRLMYRAYDLEGNVRDEFIIDK